MNDSEDTTFSDIEAAASIVVSLLLPEKLSYINMNWHMSTLWNGAKVIKFTLLQMKRFC